jgi:hypothetical protein
MIRGLSERGRKAVTVAAGAMTLALGGAGAVALTTLGVASGPVSAPAAPAALHVHNGGVQNGGPDPCILAISYANQWGICIQPPTN